MGNRRHTDHVVCYDIREPRRLQRIHRRMRSWGMPLQYSIFYCRLTPASRNRLAGELERLIDPRVDDVRIYSLQPGGTIHFQGKSPLPEGLVFNDLRMRSDENGSQL